MLDNHKEKSILSGHRILLFFILCLFGICIAQVKPTQKHKGQSRKPSTTKVFLLHSDVLKFNKEKNPDAQILVGNVKFRHDSAYMDCDSAYFYEASNSFEAFGKIKMQQGDTLFIYGDWLYYDGNSQIAMLRHNVKMINRETELVTDSFNYDRLYNLAYFFDGGTITDADNVLTSDWGEYSPATKEAIFNYNVKLVNPKMTLTSDTLHYNTATKVARIVGPSDIYSDQNHIYSEKGFYNTQTGKAHLLDRSVVTNQYRKLVGDSVAYDREAGFGEAFGNVVMTDEKDKNILTGGYANYNEKLGTAVAADKPVLINYSQNNDSAYIHGDSIKMYTYNIDTDSMYRKAFVYHKVRLYKSDMQGVCDSLVANSQDSCMTMYKDPILWNASNQQIFGEEIRVYSNDSTIRWAHIINQAMSIERIDSVHYNQVSGKEMKAYFLDGKLSAVDVIGNVRMGYYMTDKDSTLLSFMTSETSVMNIYFKDQKIQKVKWSPQNDGVVYPILQIPTDKLYLPSFAWFDYIRPLNKDDIFNWRGKKAGQELKKTTQRQPPLPTLKGLGGKK